jgi:hypothetical protein
VAFTVSALVVATIVVAVTVVAFMSVALIVDAEIRPALVIAITVPEFSLKFITSSFKTSIWRGKPRPYTVIAIYFSPSFIWDFI